ncbi:MAG TPA: hypothetical protein VFG24_01815 [Nitrosopumilaceae archaeon]|nr:hypothetical protein [Nitrosopumilaceae archaeon]
MSLLGNNQVYKALTILAIEKTLLDFGKPMYEKVIEMLKKEYNCYLTDCYEHPEYLSAILKKLFGNSHVVLVASIKKQLEEFLYKDAVGRFVEVISQ